jgi:hypothetical protein
MKDGQIPVSPRFNLTAMNLAHSRMTVIGDFIRMPPPTDLLLICHIPKLSSMEIHRLNARFGSEISTPELFTSSHDHGPKAWQTAARKSGARIIITISDKTSIEGYQLRNDEYSLVAQRKGKLAMNYSVLVRNDMMSQLPNPAFMPS